ncbi:MAG: AI-2E family transporter [Candidatus Lloydbacteria bacterium]|nr:AI-2E family transporter [Candidatus Lloydbacteria bacterium]
MLNNSKDISITITAGTITKAILIAILFASLYVLRDLVLVLLTAVVLASAIEPATRWFGKYGVSRIPAVIAVYLAIAAVVVVIFYFLVPPLLDEVSAVSAVLPQYVESLNFNTLQNSQSLPHIDSGIVENLPFTDIIAQLKTTSSQVSGGFFKIVSTVFGGALSMVLIVVISFYLAVQEHGIANFLKVITPIKNEAYIIGLWKRSQHKIGLWMQGQLLLGLLIGVMAYLGLTILGIKYAFLLALLAAVFEIIPLFGPILSATPAVILGFLDSAVLGFMVLGFYIIIQQFENHLIYPLVVRKVVGVPPLVVIIALIIGAKLAGFLGILLSAPIAAVLMEYMNDLEKAKYADLTDKEIK